MYISRLSEVISFAPDGSAAGGLESVRGLVWGGDQMDLIRFAREDGVFEDQGFGECLCCTQEGCIALYSSSQPGSHQVVLLFDLFVGHSARTKRL